MIGLMSALVAAGLGILYRLVHDNKKRISHMTGMVVAMAGAMTGGLALGLAVGAFFRDSLALASLAGLVLGGGAGLLLGSPVGLMPVLDGLLSGGMGGLMGAMLAVMLDGPGLTMVATAFIVLFTATGWLLLSLLRQEAQSLRWPDWQPDIPAIWRWGAGAIVAAALASYLLTSPAQPPRRQVAPTPQPEVPIQPGDHD